MYIHGIDTLAKDDLASYLVACMSKIEEALKLAGADMSEYSRLDLVRLAEPYALAWWNRKGIDLAKDHEFYPTNNLL